MKIAICDDDINDIENLRSYILVHDKNHEIIEFLSAIPFLERIEKNEHFDLLFLDVQMPDSDGWQIAKQLKLSNVKIYIAMVTIRNEYVFDSFDRVDWFAAKPVEAERIRVILDNAQEKLFPKTFIFQSYKLDLNLSASEIWYIEVRANYTYIYTINNKYKLRMTLKEVKKILSEAPAFVQTHNSFIINLDYYKELNGYDIVLKNDIRIPLSRNNKDNFFSCLAEYIKRG